MRRPLRILLSAGEASGDRLGAGLARALRERAPGIEIMGMGGDEMAAAGVRLVQHASETAVVGFVEVLAHLPALWRAMSRLQAAIESERPDLVVPIDFPDFNFRLVARARRAGVPVVYFVSPQVWAWRSGRVRKIRGWVRRILVLFPFEVPFYERAGVPVTFVGHPAIESGLAPADRATVFARAGLDPGRPLVALLPGSRHSEVARLLPVLLGAAAILRKTWPELQFAVARAATVGAGIVESAVAGTDLSGIAVTTQDFSALLGLAEAGVVASGTATLEAALAGLPMVVVYRMGAVSWFIGRWLVKVDHVALPNLIAGSRIVPELLQDECTPANVATAVGAYLDDPGRAGRIRRELGEVRSRLGEPGVFGRAADAILGEAASR